jgi:hypothetical protein
VVAAWQIICCFPDLSVMSSVMKCSSEYGSKYVCSCQFSVCSSLYVARLSTTNMQLITSVATASICSVYSVDV